MLGAMYSRWMFRSHLPLLLILLLGLSVRSLYVTAPFADAHRWRQVENMSIARHFAEGPFNLLHPQVNWGGPGDASVAMEFPFLPATIAALYLATGDMEVAARAVSIAFSLALVVVVYLLGHDMFGPPVGRGAALLMAMSPSAVYFGRVPIVDTVMVFFSVGAVLGFFRYFRFGRGRDAFFAGLSLGLALLVKLPAALILGPVLYLAWRARRWSVLRDASFCTAVTLPVCVTAAWYWHANNIYMETGLTVGIWRGAGNYPPSLLPLAGPTTTFTGWASLDQLTSFEFYERMLARVYALHLTPPGFVLCLAAIAIWWRRAGVDVLLIWLLAVLAFILAVAQGNWFHEYYQLPLLPPAAILCGLAMRSVFDGRWLRRNVAGGWLGVASVAMAIAFSSLVVFHYSGVVPRYFRPDGLDLIPIRAGEKIHARTPHDAVLVVLEHAHTLNAANSPVLLYYARRRGWSFDLDSVNVPAVMQLRAFGATHFATTLWSSIEAERPDVASFLKDEATWLAVDDAPGDFRLFALP